MRTAARLVAGSLDQLGYGLSRLGPERSGYITAEDFQRLTGEELGELATEGRRILTDLAVQHRCKIETPLIEQRVYLPNQFRSAFRCLERPCRK
jgi:hypothetical protein